MAAKRLTLAEQIAELEDSAPVDFDPETINHDSDTNEAEQLNRDHYVDVGPSTRQTMQDISMADAKYEGSKISRKQLEELDEDDHDELGSESDEGGAFDGLGGQNGLDEEDDESIPSSAEDEDEEDEEEEQSEEDEDPSPSKSSPPPEQDDDDLTSALRQKREEDRRKGKAVSTQLALWNSLMDARIRLQKVSVAASRLPETSVLSTVLQEPECHTSLKRMLDEALSLSDDLFDLRESLLLDEVEAPPRKRQKLTPESDDISLYESALKEASTAQAALEHAYHPYLLQNLSKWSSKIQAVAPSVLLPSNRNAFSKATSAGVKGVVEQINDTLSSDYAKLLARTRVRRGKALKRLGAPGASEQIDEGAEGEDVEVFDDTDFYQQMLKDVIDASGDGEQSWMKLQKERKAKKKVDTKASKGRKIRYEVHEKLQNFMVPVPPHGGWHEEQIDELFVSLLGKGAGVNDKMTEAQDQEMGGQEQKKLNGFRLFG